MLKRDTRDSAIFLASWITLVVALYLHTSGAVDLPFLHFPQSKGWLHAVEMNYKQHNLIGLREEVYAIPHGTPFIHPARTELLQKKKIFVAKSKEEAKRMVDAGKQDIPRLELIERDYEGYNLYRLDREIVAVPAISQDSGGPTAIGTPYSEVPVGSNIEAAKKFLSGK